MPGYYAAIARYYDALNADQQADIPFYLELAERCAGPILEVGCGSGRVLFPLVAGGHNAYGLDSEQAMLALAEERARRLDAAQRKRLTLLHGNILHYNFTQRFGLILLSYNLLTHFHDIDTLRQLLQRLRQIALPTACLVIDLPHPGAVFASQDQETTQHERDILDSESGALVQVFSRSQFDYSAQILDITWIFEEMNDEGLIRRRLARQSLRIFTRDEVKLLLHSCGWQEPEIYGDYDRRPYEDESERLIGISYPAKG